MGHTDTGHRSGISLSLITLHKNDDDGKDEHSVPLLMWTKYARQNMKHGTLISCQHACQTRSRAPRLSVMKCSGKEQQESTWSSRLRHHPVRDSGVTAWPQDISARRPRSPSSGAEVRNRSRHWTNHHSKIYCTFNMEKTDPTHLSSHTHTKKHETNVSHLNLSLHGIYAIPFKWLHEEK